VNISDAPHSFKNKSDKPARLLCMRGMRAPSGQGKFFVPVGDPIESRTARQPKLSKAGQAERPTTAKILSAKYRTELLRAALESHAPSVIRSEDDSRIQLRFIERA
jgi:hypothetical protein